MQMLDRFLKKIKKNNAETLTETLVALIITALALLMLPGAVVAAARVNATVKQQVIFMEKTQDSATGFDAGLCDVTFYISETNKTTLEDQPIVRFGNDTTGLYEIGLK